MIDQIKDNFNQISNNFRNIAETCDKITARVKTILEEDEKIEAVQNNTFLVEKDIAAEIQEVNEFSVYFVTGFEEKVLQFNPYLEGLRI